MKTKNIPAIIKANLVVVCLLVIMAPHAAKADSWAGPAISRATVPAHENNPGNIGKSGEGAAAPVNGGIWILALGGVVYGIKKFNGFSKQRIKLA